MTELQSLAQVLLGTAAVGVAGVLVAACLRFRSVVEIALATYVISSALVVALLFALTPGHRLGAGSAFVGSLCVLGVAAAVWLARGRPLPPSPRPAIDAVAGALGDRLVGALAVVIAIAFAYSLALAFLTPINDGDALAYHLVRAGFWYQDGGIGYVEDAVDSRLNGNPPNAEIGMLFTMLLAGSDRFVAIPQLAAYIALVICVVGLALHIGRNLREALFGGLVFASLPVVILQASTALNDLVVAAFLASATYFGLRPGRSQLALFALALGLALGTKVTAVLALPIVLAAILVARARREWLHMGAAALVGTALGSLWYVVNQLETGTLDGGLTDDFGQRAESSVTAVVVTLLRLLLDVVDLSGTPGSFRLAYLAVAAGVIALACALRPGSRSRAAVAVGGVLAATPLLIHGTFNVLQDLVFRSWAALGRPVTPPFEFGWNLNVVSDPALSWFGPLGALLFAGAIGTVVLWRRRALPGLAVVFAIAPLALLTFLAAVVVWDPYRGRLVVFGVALAASTWGLLLRWRAVGIAVVAIAATATTLSLGNYQGKASGIGDLIGVPNPFGVSVATVWGAPRAEVQARPRPGSPEKAVFRFVSEAVPTDATIAVAPRVNELIWPYFGERLSRTVLLMTPGAATPSTADWLVLSPSTRVRRCQGSWRLEAAFDAGWRIERRLLPDACLSEE
jgi:4-amino-4-deoxy-L-arabinose transferase-like glycosyltransferase